MPLQWLKNYLNNRVQYVTYNNNCSDISCITHGVPQGSILGPLLFLLYINDIKKASDKFEYIMYADDTTLIYTQQNIVDLESNINDELGKISLWFKSNRLLINLSKTNCVTFHNKTCKIH